MLSANLLSASKLIPTKGGRYGLYSLHILLRGSQLVKWFSWDSNLDVFNSKTMCEALIHIVLTL